MKNHFSEFQFIERVKKNQRKSSKILLGIGDDAAILCPTQNPLVVSTDLLTQGVHFELSWGTPFLLGRKSVAVNLSDIAAMGAKPLAMLCSLSIPPTCDSILEELMRGIEAECNIWNMDIIGGDTCRGKESLTLCHFVLGETLNSNPFMRKGANPGDLIFCSGTIGDSGLGLKILKGPENQFILNSEDKDKVVKKFLQPEPRLKLSQKLSNISGITAMIDISDGLLQDLKHVLMASKVSARLDPDKIPLSTIAKKTFITVEQACTSGEDYELLFTASPQSLKDVLNLSGPNLPLSVIGEILSCESSEMESVTVGQILGPKGFSWPSEKLGYQHF